MTKKIIAAALFACTAFTTANAGGMLTNTNQSVAFLRNPARDAAIGIDGVYNNPAGVALMSNGFHIGVNWQTAIQTRTVETTSPFLDHTLSTLDPNGTPRPDVEFPTKSYRGHATAPIIPSVQAAYNMNKWSFQFNFSVTGGGGKCEFSKGLGSFENAIGQICSRLRALGAMGYSVDNFMEGSQYYYGITLGTAYKAIDKKDFKVSVYGGLRGLIGSANYKAQIKDIQVATSEGLKNLSDFLDKQNNTFNTVIATRDQFIDKYPVLKQFKDNNLVAPGLTEAQQDLIIAAVEGYPMAVAAQQQIAPLSAYRNGIDLECDQSGFGIAPILGLDIQYKRFNFAAKYEFRTKMNLKNSSNLEESSIPQTAQFVNGTKVREDSPALLALGVQYTPVDIVHLNLGYHHFYDKSSKKFGNKQDLLSGGTNEYLGGVEVDVTDRLIVSCGAQLTRYGLTDDYMSDVSFVTNSWSFGFGASYQANPNVKIEAGYFKTFYDKYKTAVTNGISNEFSRSNDVIGVGLVIDL